MSINLQCPTCGKKLNVADELVGRQVQCPVCRIGVKVRAFVEAELVAPKVSLPLPGAAFLSTPERGGGWMYQADGGRQFGPAPKEQLDRAVDCGLLTASSQVWLVSNPRNRRSATFFYPELVRWRRIYLRGLAAWFGLYLAAFPVSWFLPNTGTCLLLALMLFALCVTLWASKWAGDIVFEQNRHRGTIDAFIASRFLTYFSGVPWARMRYIAMLRLVTASMMVLAFFPLCSLLANFDSPHRNMAAMRAKLMDRLKPAPAAGANPIVQPAVAQYQSFRRLSCRDDASEARGDLGSVVRVQHSPRSMWNAMAVPRALALMPHDKRALVATEKTVHLHEAETGELLESLVETRPDEQFACAGLSVDCLWFATAYSTPVTSRVYLFELDSPERPRSLEMEGRVNGVCALDGHRVVTVDARGSLALWDVDSGASVHYFDLDRPVVCLAPLPDGRSILCGDDIANSWICDLESGDLTMVSRGMGKARAAAALLDGQNIVTAAGVAGDLLRIDVSRVRDMVPQYQFVGHLTLCTDEFRCLALAATSRFLSVAIERNALLLLDLEVLQTSHEYVAHSEPVRALACSRDGRYMLSGDEAGRVCLWDLPDPPLVDGCFEPAGTIGDFHCKGGFRIMPPAGYRLNTTDERDDYKGWYREYSWSDLRDSTKVPQLRFKVQYNSQAKVLMQPPAIVPKIQERITVPWYLERNGVYLLPDAFVDRVMLHGMEFARGFRHESFDGCDQMLLVGQYGRFRVEIFVRAYDGFDGPAFQALQSAAESIHPPYVPCVPKTKEGHN